MYLVIGLGETGRPLFEILREAYPDTYGYDKRHGWSDDFVETRVEVLNICIPYHEGFVDTVKEYQKRYSPALTIVHSTVPIGTTSQIPEAVHSPILGKHYNMKESLLTFVKWIGGQKATEARDYLCGAKIMCKVVEKSEETEAMKLLCLAKYGMSIAFAGYQKEIFDKYGIDYRHVAEWDMNYNNNVDTGLQRPILTPPEGGLGGHCISQNTEFLYALTCDLFPEKEPNGILREILKLGVPKTYNSENKNQWTSEEDWKIKRLHKYLTFKEIAGLLPNRSYDAVRTRAIKLGLSSSYNPGIRDMATRKKISISVQGIDEDSWEDFKSDENTRIRHSELYSQWRKYIYERDNYTCQHCGDRSSTSNPVYLHAHHLKPFSEFKELRMDVDNGITLCDKCHRYHHFVEPLSLSIKNKSYKAWGISNIYPSAKIGSEVNIGTFCEIGANVVIGDRVRIGAMSFIPEGVVIEDDAWIGPRVTMTNDKYPPSGRDNWEMTIIRKGARIGAGVTIICGCTIGEGALIGAGSVVTKDVPSGEKWFGTPARKMGELEVIAC